MGGEGGELFDYFFVDGYHTTEHALADLRNACAGSKVGEIVALDVRDQLRHHEERPRGATPRSYVAPRAT